MSAVALESLTTVLCLRREGTPLGVGEGCDDFLAALGLVVLDGQEVVHAGLPAMPRLPRSTLSASDEEKTWCSGSTQARMRATHRPLLTKPTKNPHSEAAPQIDGTATSEESRQPPETGGCPQTRGVNHDWLDLDNMGSLPTEHSTRFCNRLLRTGYLITVNVVTTNVPVPIAV